MADLFSKRREPFQFMLWLGIISSALLFLFILLVFVKKELVNQDIPLKLPGIFWFSTLLILCSSYTLHRANLHLEKQDFKGHRSLLLLTSVLGLAFLASQLWGWMFLLGQNILPSNNTGGAFIYVLSGLHLIHTMGGLIALAVLFSRAMRHKTFVDSFVDSVNPPSQLKLLLTSIYWHFIDVVWVFIFLFLLWHSGHQ